MFKRVVVVLANAVLYLALVSYGNQQIKDRQNDIEAAGEKGIAFDLRWWTPWPTAIAHGINLPAVVPAYLMFYKTGLLSRLDFIEPVQATVIVLFLASVFWWFGIRFFQKQGRACTEDESCRRIWKVTATSVVCILLAVAWTWASRHHFDQVPAGHQGDALREAFEAEYTLKEFLFSFG